MNKQVKLYSISLGMTKTEREKQLCYERNYAFKKMIEYKNNKKEEIKNEFSDNGEWNERCSKELKELLKYDITFNMYVETYKTLKKMVHDEYVENKKIHRGVLSKNLYDTNNIAISSNNTIRTMEIQLGTFTDYFIEVEAENIDDIIIEQIVKHGMYIDNKEYIFMTAGAGQTRKQRFMMARKDIWEKYFKKLMCGLTFDDINKKGGLNISKLLAYLSLNNSSSYDWEDFDIDRCIVVDDFETMVNGTVDFISKKNITEEYTTKTGKIKEKIIDTEWNIEKNKNMQVPIPHMDGAGIMDASICKKNRQFRAPWFKGLLVPTYIKRYIKNNVKELKPIKDVWGNYHDIEKENILIFFTKSQFKLWKMYDSWDDYKSKFKKYNCKACICEEDEEHYKNMHINYQMIQTLWDMTDDQIEELLSKFKEDIDRVHTDRNKKLEFLGATLDNKNRSYLQECLRIYPELLNSDYIKEQLKQVLKKAKKEAKAGRFKLRKVRRTFLLPDIVAFMDWLFNGTETPEGVLKDGEVYCKLFEEDKLDVLRSPHLSFEHAIRNNMAVKETRNDKKYEYFITNGIYTSTYDLISKILQFDVDGDHATIIADDMIINLVLSMVEKYNLNPLYYEMGSAAPDKINMSNIYKSLKFVFHKSNIGKVSNALTKIHNGKNPFEKYDLISKITKDNNEIIDSAKTLTVPKLPKDVQDAFKECSASKYPYFFQFVKKEVKASDCNPCGNSVMDRICLSIDKITKGSYNFDQCGKFSYKKLMSGKVDDINKDIIEYYLNLEKETTDKIKMYYYVNGSDDDKNENFKETYYEEARYKILNYAKDNQFTYEFVVDNIIKYAFTKDKLRCTFIFNTFGALILNNLTKKLKDKSLDNGWKMCEVCGKRFEIKSKTKIPKYCNSCAIKVDNMKRNERR